MTKKIAKQILTTRGVNSCVRVPSDGDFEEGARFWTSGHVGLFDFDGVSKSEILDRCMDIDGVSLLWSSSLRNYHLWNLSVRSVDEIALMGLKLRSDCKHVAHGYRRQKWVLRIAGKFHEDEPKPYKPAPKFLHSWCNPSIHDQSEPHMRLWQALTGKTISYMMWYDWVGSSAQIETYRTVTDEMKMG